MMILLIVIGALGILYVDKSYKRTNDWSVEEKLNIINIGLIIYEIVCVFVLICLLIIVSSASKNQQKIAMYQEENTNIESQIDELVENYMSYESETLKEFKAESSITLVSLYPELKADELVKTQIETYTSNNAKIKNLKEGIIDNSTVKWWIYFGK